MTKSHDSERPPPGKVIDAPGLVEAFRARELSRRKLLEGAIAGSAALLAAKLAGCGDDDGARPDAGPAGDAGPGDAGPMADGGADAGADAGPPPPTHLLGMGYDETDYLAALDAALAQTGGLSFIGAGDTVYFKVNCNNGDPYPHSTRPELIVELARRCRDLGATRIIVGDRSFWGDTGTLRNMNANGVAGAAMEAGAELVVFDDASVEWATVLETDAPTWTGGFRLPVPVMEADHIINLPCMKTHFISTFTMALKNLIGLVHPADRQRRGNLDVHRYPQLWNQIAEICRQVTPSLNILDGYEALTTGGPTTREPPGPTYAEPKVMVVSPDRIATDVMGIAVLQTLSPSSEDVTTTAAWANPQIVRAVALGVGITGPAMLDAAGPTVPMFDAYLANAMRTA